MFIALWLLWHVRFVVQFFFPISCPTFSLCSCWIFCPILWLIFFCFFFVRFSSVIWGPMCCPAKSDFKYLEINRTWNRPSNNKSDIWYQIGDNIGNDIMSDLLSDVLSGYKIGHQIGYKIRHWFKKIEKKSEKTSDKRSQRKSGKR